MGVVSLHPTKTRIALLRDVADSYVSYRDGVDVDDRSRSRVTAQIDELEQAGWVDGGDPLWRLTDTGRKVLDAATRDGAQ